MLEGVEHLLLTGGTGFFGLALLRHWQRLGASAPRLTVLSRDPARFAACYPELAAVATWVKGDVQVPQSLPRGQRFSHVLHAAADSTLGPQLSPLQRYDQIVSGTRHLLDLALDTGVQRFLLTSSGGVYGRQPQALEALPETYCGMPDPLDPQQTYGVAKRCAEHLCALHADRLEVVVARCFAFLGQDLPLDVHFAIGNFIRDALWGDDIVVRGDGTPMRSYLDQRDLADWLLTLLTQGRAGEAYNVGSDEVIDLAALAHRVRDLLAPGKPVRVLGQASQDGPRHRYLPDIGKARALGLQVRIALDPAILDTAAAHRRT